MKKVIFFGVFTTRLVDRRPGRHFWRSRSPPCLPGVVEAENEFMAELVDSFYKGLKCFIALVLKGSTTSFSALKVVLSRSINSIRDFGGDDQATTLELMVDKLERDVDE